jgi:structure-specific recognition protein 1
LSKAFKIWYGINIENREHALRGWNWGKAEFTKAELAFSVQNRPAFEIPYSEISNTNLAGKNEVAVEFALTADGDANGQPSGSTKNRGRKAAAGPDELVEMRFYIPGTAVKTEKGIKTENDDENPDEEDEGGEEQNAANLFYETLMEKAEIGDVAGDTFATFLDVLHLTPRYVSLLSASFFDFILMDSVEVGSISTCTNRPSDFAAKHTTTRFNTPLSRNSSCFLRTMRCTHSLY